MTGIEEFFAALGTTAGTAGTTAATTTAVAAPTAAAATTAIAAPVANAAIIDAAAQSAFASVSAGLEAATAPSLAATAATTATKTLASAGASALLAPRPSVPAPVRTPTRNDARDIVEARDRLRGRRASDILTSPLGLPGKPQTASKVLTGQ